MKLKCNTHGKRVMVLPSGNTIHRATGEKCHAQVLCMGTERFAPRHVQVRSISLERNGR